MVVYFISSKFGIDHGKQAGCCLESSIGMRILKKTNPLEYSVICAATAFIDPVLVVNPLWSIETHAHSYAMLLEYLNPLFVHQHGIRWSVTWNSIPLHASPIFTSS